MQTKLQNLLQEAKSAIADCQTLDALRDCEVKYLGRKSPLNEILRGMKDLSDEEKKTIGVLANQVKKDIGDLIETQTQTLQDARFAELGETEWQDPTHIINPLPQGSIHPINAFYREVAEVFRGMGYEIASGPEVEDDWHNFEALNIPPYHPARDNQDTFFLKNFPQNLLRTHTSGMQIRWAENHPVPVRVLCPGKVFRKDELDATHSPIFHQLEGLVLDNKNSHTVSLTHLKGTLETAFRALLSPDARFRFRTSYFPFVEPGLEVDMSCIFCGGEGCRVCKGVGWIEILGGGMVHPNVIKNMGYNPEEVQGFAFGIGIERLLMLRHSIPDIRYFYENNLKFLSQF